MPIPVYMAWLAYLNAYTQGEMQDALADLGRELRAWGIDWVEFNRVRGSTGLL